MTNKISFLFSSSWSLHLFLWILNSILSLLSFSLLSFSFLLYFLPSIALLACSICHFFETSILLGIYFFFPSDDDARNEETKNIEKNFFLIFLFPFSFFLFSFFFPPFFIFPIFYFFIQIWKKFFHSNNLFKRGKFFICIFFSKVFPVEKQIYNFVKCLLFPHLFNTFSLNLSLSLSFSSLYLSLFLLSLSFSFCSRSFKNHQYNSN